MYTDWFSTAKLVYYWFSTAKLVYLLVIAVLAGSGTPGSGGVWGDCQHHHHHNESVCITGTI